MKLENITLEQLSAIRAAIDMPIEPEEVPAFVTGVVMAACGLLSGLQDAGAPGEIALAMSKQCLEGTRITLLANGLEHNEQFKASSLIPVIEEQIRNLLTYKGAMDKAGFSEKTLGLACLIEGAIQ